jgi:predicted NBD/HSP70 family sugar kinase
MGSGAGDVLGLIQRREANTRRELQEATGLSRITVAQRVDILLDSGLVKEAGEGDATGGRRPNRLVFDVEHGVLLVAVVDTAHTRTAITDLEGRLLAQESFEMNISEGPAALLGGVIASLRRLIADAGPSLPRVIGAAVSVPGPIDPTTRKPAQPPIMPGWDQYPIVSDLQDAFGVPVFVENDADAMAFGEQSSVFPESASLCLVKVSTGIGAGLVLNGSVYNGIDGGAGDLGHVRLAGETAECQCGAHGCLAAIASGRAIARRLTDAGVPASSGWDVGRLLAEGNVGALSLVHEAGRRIGEVMATVVSMVNPGVLVISGDLASSSLLGGLRETLYPRTLARATRSLEIRLSTLGSDAGIIGLARIATRSLYSAEAVNLRSGSEGRRGAFAPRHQ